MTRRGARWLVGLSGVIPLIGSAAFVLVSTSAGQAFPVGNLPWAAFPIVCWAVGATIVLRAGGHRVGRLLATVGVIAGALVGGIGFLYEPALPAARWAILLVTAAFGPLFVALILGSMVLFPDGRLPTRAWRLPVLAPIAMVLVATVALLLRPGPFGPGLPDNPVGIEALPAELLGAFYVLDPLGIGLLGLVGAASLTWRFRRVNPQVRAQLKWLLASVIPAVILTPLSYIQPVEPATWSLTGLLSGLALLLVPVSIGVAITRYRLYDIDRLISRGFAWAAVTGLLLAVYGGAVLLLQQVLGGMTQGDTLAVAGSTLLAAALFQPLRRRVQAIVDHRFNRARYDADRTVEAFAERLRDEVDLGSLSDDVARVVDTALRPSAITVWIRHGSRATSP
jgi:hypothetical protein